jgi:hypothetical protein
LVTPSQHYEIRAACSLFSVWHTDGLNLQGVAIGNGVMDMVFQEPSYAEYAYYHGLIPLGAKQQFDKDWAACLEKVIAVSVVVRCVAISAPV